MNIECYHNIHKDQAVKGFLDYQYCSELEEVVQYNVYEVLEDNQIINTNYTGENEIEYLCIYAHGSRVFGNPRKDSDLDFVLFYKGSIREDDLFNIFVDENIFIEHIKCDFNPIRIDDDSDIEHYIQKHDVEYYQRPLSEKLYNLRFALDDFDTEDIQVSKPKQQTISKDDSLWQNLELREHVVDLGLPSGTLWCKYNLGVNPKYLDNSENWIGDYYAWGELEPNKSCFINDTYKFGYIKMNYIKADIDIKYNNDDNLTQLLPEDDAAYQNMHIGNYKFHIPTKEQFEELLKYTTNEWIENYNHIIGLNGMQFISKINGNELFIPYTYIKTSPHLKGPYIWSSTVNRLNHNTAWHLDFEDGRGGMAAWKRYCGMPIRPVINL